MQTIPIGEQIRKKNVNLDRLVDQVAAQPAECIPELIRIIETEKGSIKFGCEKVLRLVSGREPKLLYPYFEFYVRLLASDNTFLKCGAILTLANLAGVDERNLFAKVFDAYFAIAKGPILMCAGNVIGSAAAIAAAKPEFTGKIVEALLAVEQAEFLNKGKPSPECKKVACGHAVIAFTELYDRIADRDKAQVISFVEKQLNSTRKAVVKNAEKFMQKYNTAL